MKRSARWQILGLAVLVGSCAPTTATTQKIPLPPQRLFQAGYSLLPPNEEGWEVSQRDRVLLALGKHGSNRNEIAIIWGALFKLQPFKSDDEFVRLVRESREKDSDPRRFRVVKRDVTSYPGKGTTCAYSHEVLEDNPALTESGNRVDMIREMFGLTCAHTTNKQIGVTVNYSQRYYTGQRDPQLQHRATSVLTSVEFSAL